MGLIGLLRRLAAPNLVAAFVVLASGAAAGGSASTAPSAARVSGADALAALPAPAQAAVARVLGRDQRRFQASAANGRVTVANDAQGLSARFDRSGVEVRSGSTLLRMSLRKLGYGTRLRPVPAAVPHADANRVSYRHGTLTQWYLNGPLGLEQGFTVRQPPARFPGPLTLEFRLAGAAASLESRTGLRFAGSSLRYRGLFATDARGRRLRAWLELQRPRLLVRVADAGARYPLTIDPFIQQAKLISAGAAGDLFGVAVAASGDTIVVGAYQVGQQHGAAYVFEKQGSDWASAVQAAKLTASDSAARSVFGWSVAVDGDTVVVGAPFSNVAGISQQGAAYVFAKPPTGWASGTETAKLTASDGAIADALGTSVGVSGATIVAGADGADFGSNQNQGAAYVFVEPVGGWAGSLTESAKLSASDGVQFQNLAERVAISGDTIAFSNRNTYVFVEPVGGWAGSLTETAQLTASDGNLTSVAVEGKHDHRGGARRADRR